MQTVVLTGLGGSAAGGDFTRALFDSEGTVPFFVNRDYHLPHWAGAGTLVFCTSYSGNTEETLSAYSDAKAAGCKIIVVTSGGKLAELAKADGHPVILIPSGQPPRTALGYMLIPVVHACHSLGLLAAPPFSDAFLALDQAVVRWGFASAAGQNEAKQIAAQLEGKLSVLYGLGGWQGIVANRWKGQINENAKNMTFANAFPELNHNEILGWVDSTSQGVDDWVLVVLQDGTESLKMKARRDVSLDLIGERCSSIEVTVEGSSLLEKMLCMVLLGDFVSLYLAALNGVDPENIDWLNTLKGELAKIN